MVLVPPVEHAALLRPLAADLAGSLGLDEDEDGDGAQLGSLQRCAGAMAALSAIARVAPDIFAAHAAAVADFVLQARKGSLLLCMHAALQPACTVQMEQTEAIIWCTSLWRGPLQGL